MGLSLSLEHRFRNKGTYLILSPPQLAGDKMQTFDAVLYYVVPQTGSASDDRAPCRRIVPKHPNFSKCQTITMAEISTLRLLKKELVKRGLSGTGQKSDLIRRLAQDEKSVVPIPNESEQCDAIMTTSIESEDDASMIERAQSRLISTVNNHQLYVEDVRGQLIVGNTRAMEYARARGERNEFENRLKAVEEENKEIKTEFQQLKEEIGCLKNQVYDLEQSVCDSLLAR